MTSGNAAVPHSPGRGHALLLIPAVAVLLLALDTVHAGDVPRDFVLAIVVGGGLPPGPNMPAGTRWRIQYGRPGLMTTEYLGTPDSSGGMWVSRQDSSWFTVDRSDLQRLYEILLRTHFFDLPREMRDTGVFDAGTVSVYVRANGRRREVSATQDFSPPIERIWTAVDELARRARPSRR